MNEEFIRNWFPTGPLDPVILWFMSLIICLVANVPGWLFAVAILFPFFLILSGFKSSVISSSLLFVFSLIYALL